MLQTLCFVPNTAGFFLKAEIKLWVISFKTSFVQKSAYHLTSTVLPLSPGLFVKISVVRSKRTALKPSGSQFMCESVNPMNHFAFKAYMELVCLKSIHGLFSKFQKIGFWISVELHFHSVQVFFSRKLTIRFNRSYADYVCKIVF